MGCDAENVHRHLQGNLFLTLKILEGHVKFIDLSEDKRLLLVCEDTRKVSVYDMAIKKRVWVYEDHEEIYKAFWVSVPHSIAVVSSANVRIVNIYLNLKLM